MALIQSVKESWTNPTIDYRYGNPTLQSCNLASGVTVQCGQVLAFTGNAQGQVTNQNLSSSSAIAGIAAINSMSVGADNPMSYIQPSGDLTLRISTSVCDPNGTYAGFTQPQPLYVTSSGQLTTSTNDAINTSTPFMWMTESGTGWIDCVFNFMGQGTMNN